MKKERRRPTRAELASITSGRPVVRRILHSPVPTPRAVPDRGRAGFRIILGGPVLRGEPRPVGPGPSLKNFTLGIKQLFETTRKEARLDLDVSIDPAKLLDLHGVLLSQAQDDERRERLLASMGGGGGVR